MSLYYKGFNDYKGNHYWSYKSILFWLRETLRLIGGKYLLGKHLASSTAKSKSDILTPSTVILSAVPFLIQELSIMAFHIA